MTQVQIEERVARPILFSSAMVRALLAGTKTQTRRIVKPQPEKMRPELERVLPEAWASGFIGVKCPYGVPGDLLWVRESLTIRNDGSRANPKPVPMYAADWEGFNKPDRDWDWTPSIHMPRWASRLTLEITDVRVERLQDISEADALAEGLTPGDGEAAGMWCVPGVTGSWFSPRTAYFDLWNTINGHGATDANPWVWAVSFNVHHQNVQAVQKEPV